MDLSLKPPKKSDLDKKWMKKRLDRAIKIQPEYHLIVTEGTDTEPEYFGSTKSYENISHIQQEHLIEIGNTPLDLVHKNGHYF